MFIEKPVTLNANDAEGLVALANERGLKLTAGHDDQFSPVARRMRTLVETGYLGGAPVHMESYFCYDLGDPEYARALLGERAHWVRKLPGGSSRTSSATGLPGSPSSCRAMRPASSRTGS